jgi:pimeloyl-ACP methyl ester carboxylesterase
MVTLKSVSIMDEIQELSWGAIPQNHLPTLVMMGQQDRIVDNRKVLEFINHLFQGKNRNRLVMEESGHAIHLEKTEEVASEIANFIRKL